MKKTLFIAILFLTFFQLESTALSAQISEFKAQTIDDDVQIGYGLAIGDVDGDGKPDILLADKKQFVWYQNPSWKKYVLAENLTDRDNVCIAARDIDGDGKVEIAVGAQWNPGETRNTEKSGAVFYLVRPKHPKQRWQAIQLHHEPTIHRMRWLKLDKGRFVLVVAPLHGRDNRAGKGTGVKLLAYTMPPDPHSPWKTTVMENTMHMTHNLDPTQWDTRGHTEETLYIGSEGAKIIDFNNDKFSSKFFPLIQGGGEIRMGQGPAEKRFVVTIEPLHGNKLVYYTSQFGDLTNTPNRISINKRIVLDDQLKQGHALATGNLFDTGTNQIVAGWRQPNKDNLVGIKLYYAADPQATQWKSIWIDKNGMAAEDLRLADLNGDGKIDIIAAGRATHNLKIYWNQKDK